MTEGRVQVAGMIAWVNAVPSAASASRCGVSPRSDPRAPTRSARTASRERTTIEGPAEGAAPEQQRVAEERGADRRLPGGGAGGRGHEPQADRPAGVRREVDFDALPAVRLGRGEALRPERRPLDLDPGLDRRSRADAAHAHVEGQGRVRGHLEAPGEARVRRCEQAGAQLGHARAAARGAAAGALGVPR